VQFAFVDNAVVVVVVVIVVDGGGLVRASINGIGIGSETTNDYHHHHLAAIATAAAIATVYASITSCVASKNISIGSTELDFSYFSWYYFQ
jgi:hypothetical protein